MSPEVAYFLKVNIAFVLFYAFYRLFFHKDTFFKLRRSILLIFMLLAFVYPLMNFQEWIKGQEPIVEAIILYTAMLPETVVDQGIVHTTDWPGLFRVFLLGIYGLVVAFLLVRFFVRLGSILWLTVKSRRTVIQGTKVYLLDKPSGPFSFFKLIFVYPASHSGGELEEILIHERTHALQWHSVDVIISELICISCWMNPFVWLLKREVRYNLEYLADNTVLESGYDSKSYQHHLLGLAHHSHQAEVHLLNNFNILHLKNRIRMMNKKRSRSIGKAKCLIFIPLVALLMLFSNIEAVARITKELASDMIMTEKAVVLPEEPQEKERKIYTVADRMPEFPGGEKELLKFINTSVKYPVSAQEKKIEGRVICGFVVDENGNIIQPEVLRGVDPDIDAEALRVIGLMPKWTPGKQGGEDVAVKYTIPITFRLSPKGTSTQAPPPPPLPEDPNAVYTVVDEMPQFPGGDKELLKFINTSVKYPVSAQEKKIEGRVICFFIVEKDGTLTDITVKRGVDPALDEESLRVLRQSPKWIPGKTNGKAVRVKYTVPITFRLQ